MEYHIRIVLYYKRLAHTVMEAGIIQHVQGERPSSPVQSPASPTKGQCFNWSFKAGKSQCLSLDHQVE